MRTWTILIALSLVTLAGCVKEQEPEPEPESPGDSEPTPEVLPPTPVEEDPNDRPGVRFLAIGDQGTGGDMQHAVAATMKDACDAWGCDFVVALGDNIYEIGASDPYDEQFETKFEQPYAEFGDMPFYMVQGNHDNSADPISQQSGLNLGIGHWYATGDVEVEYHYREDRTSEKWQMPSRYYDFAVGPVTFLALDTNLLMYYGSGATLDAPNAPLPGEQRAWIDEAVARINTPWSFAIGHHAYISNGAHGNAGTYDGLAPTPAAGQYVEETYENHLCGNVDFFLAGHDHDMQWLEPPADCDIEAQIISGAAGKTRSHRADENSAVFQQYDTYGFAWFEATNTTLTMRFVDVDGAVLWGTSLAKTAQADDA